MFGIFCSYVKIATVITAYRPPPSQGAAPSWWALFFVCYEFVTVLGLVVTLLFAVSAKGGGVPWAGLGLGFLEAGEFSLKVLEVVSLLLDKGREALVGVCEGGVV